MIVVSRTNDFLWNFSLMKSQLETTLMTQTDITGNMYPGGTKNKNGVRRIVKHNLKIDMTPMVDLGFLLISFFVITTELSKPTAMDLFMPKDSEPMDQGDSNALTVLLDMGNAIWYYHGNWEKAAEQGAVKKTKLSGKNGLREVIIEKKHLLDIMNKKEGHNGLMLLIKPDSGTSYKNIVDVLDEATISMVKKYAVIRPSEEEKRWIANNKK